MTDGPNTHTSAGLREAFRRPSAHGSSHHLVDFLLSSAWLSSLRLNFGGWLLRGAFLMAAVVAALVAPAPTLPLLLPAVLGWVLAGVELLRRDFIAIGSERHGPVGWVSRHLEESRGTAIPTVSGVLENVGSLSLLMLFIGPLSLDLPQSWRDAGVLATAGYVGVAAAQVVTDAGYYNREPGREPSWWVWCFRWALTPLYAMVGAAVVVLAGNVRGWVVAVLVTIFVGVAVIAVISDNIQAAATATHLAVAEERAREFAAELSEEVHRVSTYLANEALTADDEHVARAYERAFAEIDAIRARASGGSLSTPVSVSELLHLLDRKAQSADGFSVSTSAPHAVLSHGGATLLRHIALDLVMNARTAGAEQIDVDVDVEPLQKEVVFVTVRVTDNGPGFANVEDMNDFPAGSSRETLARICRQRRGFLRYERADSRTIVTARYRTDLWKAVNSR